MSDVLIIMFQSLVQGVTEFLPVSSSGHLILVWNFFGNPLENKQMLTLDIALHIGTLASVLLFFRADLYKLVKGGLDILVLRQSNESREAVSLLIATLPLLFVGFLIKDFIQDFARSPLLIACTTFFFGLLLWISDAYGARNPRSLRSSFSPQMNRLKNRTENSSASREEEYPDPLEAAFIGFMQVFALIPGTSRSGVTMSAARFLGLSRVSAARFSLLLSIPAILGAGTVSTLDIIKNGQFDINHQILIATTLAALVSYLSIRVMTAWLKTASFLPFIIYRLILGALLFYFFL